MPPEISAAAAGAATALRRETFAASAAAGAECEQRRQRGEDDGASSPRCGDVHGGSGWRCNGKKFNLYLHSESRRITTMAAVLMR